MLTDDIKYIILNTYHSGTLNTKAQSTRDFLLKAKGMGITVYVTGVAEGPEYESAGAFSELGLIPLKNIAPISAYVKLWMLSQNGSIENMNRSLSGDIVPTE